MSILSSIDVKKYSKKFDTMGVGCDYLRLSYLNSSEFIQEKIDLLDYDNSNFGHCEFQNMIFTFQKIPTSLGIALTFSCSYNDVSVPVFQFVKFENSAAYITGKWGKLDFYGSFFRLSDLGLYNLDNLISEICVTINEEENPIVTRYDYRIDYFSRFNSVPVSHWSKVIDITSQTKVDPKYTGDVLTNWLVGTKKTGTYCVRLYDKLLDSDLKEKYFLYHDYFDYESVHRLEFEFQRNFLKGYHLSDYFDGIIQKKIESILGINDDLRSLEDIALDAVLPVDEG